MDDKKMLGKEELIAAIKKLNPNAVETYLNVSASEVAATLEKKDEAYLRQMYKELANDND